MKGFNEKVFNFFKGNPNPKRQRVDDDDVVIVPIIPENKHIGFDLKNNTEIKLTEQNEQSIRTSCGSVFRVISHLNMNPALPHYVDITFQDGKCHVKFEMKKMSFSPITFMVVKDPNIKDVHISPLAESRMQFELTFNYFYINSPDNRISSFIRF
jgi:hypothetical protein